nr:chondrolectin-like [Salvelinus alpinus]
MYDYTASHRYDYTASHRYDYTASHSFFSDSDLDPESHLVKEQGDRPGARDPDVTVAQTIEVKQAGPSEEDGAPHVVIAGPGMFLVYVIIPTIPLLLLILVASGTCCFQMFSKSKPGTKTSINQSTLWISKTPKTDSMEV